MMSRLLVLEISQRVKAALAAKLLRDVILVERLQSAAQTFNVLMTTGSVVNSKG